MILITSGSYIDQDFASEVGRLPPAFLPVGNRRLYSYQIESISSLEGDKYLSLPSSFKIDPVDEAWLESAGISILRVPEGISLGESILYCWNLTGKQYKSLAVLHGDTLFRDLAYPTGDALSVHKNSGFYQRATFSYVEGVPILSDVWAGESEDVLSGYFSFSSPHVLMKGIIENSGNFTEALKYYSSNCEMTISCEGEWLDFGHINSYFRARSKLTTERAFNELSICSRSVVKKSSNNKKILAEKNWFEYLPSRLRIHCPNLLSPSHGVSDDDGYSLEYQYWMPLNDLFVFGALGGRSWISIFRAARTILDDFSNYRPDAPNLESLNKLYLTKTLERLRQFCDSSNISIDQEFRAEVGESGVSLRQMAERSAELISEANDSHVVISHGDFCFSNLLFDSRTQAIKVIDPRGIDYDGNFSIFGDSRYDVSKFYHSVVGLYDFIVAGRYSLNVDRDLGVWKIDFSTQCELIDIEKYFRNEFFSSGRFDEVEILAINVHLFLSMLPLHYDRPDRQKAMLANALRLYRKLEIQIRNRVS